MISILAALLIIFCVTLQGQQRFEIKDRRAVPVLVLDDVKLLRYSDYFKTQIPEFTAVMTNIAGEDIINPVLTGTIHLRGGAMVRFPVYPTQVIPKTLAQGRVGYSFLKPWSFSKESDISGVEFRLEEAQHFAAMDGFRISGFIAKDEGCLKDYFAARSLDGIALRKKLAELVQYGCGAFADPPMTTGAAIRKRALLIGSKRIAIVAALFEDEGSQIPGAEHRDNRIGLALFDELRPSKILTTEEIGVGKAQ